MESIGNVIKRALVMVIFLLCVGLKGVSAGVVSVDGGSALEIEGGGRYAVYTMSGAVHKVLNSLDGKDYYLRFDRVDGRGTSWVGVNGSEVRDGVTGVIDMVLVEGLGAGVSTDYGIFINLDSAVGKVRVTVEAPLTELSMGGVNEGLIDPNVPGAVMQYQSIELGGLSGSTTDIVVDTSKFVGVVPVIDMLDGARDEGSIHTNGGVSKNLNLYGDGFSKWGYIGVSGWNKGTFGALIEESTVDVVDWRESVYYEPSDGLDSIEFKVASGISGATYPHWSIRDAWRAYTGEDCNIFCGVISLEELRGMGAVVAPIINWDKADAKVYGAVVTRNMDSNVGEYKLGVEVTGGVKELGAKLSKGGAYTVRDVKVLGGSCVWNLEEMFSPRNMGVSRGMFGYEIEALSRYAPMDIEFYDGSERVGGCTVQWDESGNWSIVGLPDDSRYSMRIAGGKLILEEKEVLRKLRLPVYDLVEGRGYYRGKPHIEDGLYYDYSYINYGLVVRVKGLKDGVEVAKSGVYVPYADEQTGNLRYRLDVNKWKSLGFDGDDPLRETAHMDPSEDNGRYYLDIPVSDGVDFDRGSTVRVSVGVYRPSGVNRRGEYKEYNGVQEYSLYDRRDDVSDGLNIELVESDFQKVREEPIDREKDRELCWLSDWGTDWEIEELWSSKDKVYELKGKDFVRVFRCEMEYSGMLRDYTFIGRGWDFKDMGGLWWSKVADFKGRVLGRVWEDTGELLGYIWDGKELKGGTMSVGDLVGKRTLEGGVYEGVEWDVWNKCVRINTERYCGGEMGIKFLLNVGDDLFEGQSPYVYHWLSVERDDTVKVWGVDTVAGVQKWYLGTVRVSNEIGNVVGYRIVLDNIGRWWTLDREIDILDREIKGLVVGKNYKELVTELEKRKVESGAVLVEDFSVEDIYHIKTNIKTKQGVSRAIDYIFAFKEDSGSKAVQMYVNGEVVEGNEVVVDLRELKWDLRAVDSKGVLGVGGLWEVYKGDKLIYKGVSGDVDVSELLYDKYKVGGRLDGKYKVCYKYTTEVGKERESELEVEVVGVESKVVKRDGVEVNEGVVDGVLEVGYLHEVGGTEITGAVKSYEVEVVGEYKDGGVVSGASVKVRYLGGGDAIEVVGSKFKLKEDGLYEVLYTYNTGVREKTHIVTLRKDNSGVYEVSSGGMVQSKYVVKCVREIEGVVISGGAIIVKPSVPTGGAIVEKPSGGAISVVIPPLVEREEGKDTGVSKGDTSFEIEFVEPDEVESGELMVLEPWEEIENDIGVSVDEDSMEYEWEDEEEDYDGYVEGWRDSEDEEDMEDGLLIGTTTKEVVQTGDGVLVEGYWLLFVLSVGVLLEIKRQKKVV